MLKLHKLFKINILANNSKENNTINMTVKKCDKDEFVTKTKMESLSSHTIAQHFFVEKKDLRKTEKRVVVDRRVITCYPRAEVVPGRLERGGE